MEAKHTPTPWHVGGRDGRIFYAADGYAVSDATVFHGRHEGEHTANAEFIVRACNAHDDLVKALQGVIRVADRSTAEFDAARDALAKAGAA